MKNIIILAIVLTTNIFAQWTQVFPYPQGNSLFSSCSAGQSTEYAVGNDATIIKTTDNGNSWTVLNTGEIFFSLYTVSFPDELTGYAAGEGIILKTSDGGQTWTKLGGVWLGINFHSSYFFNKDLGFIGGTGGTILKTTNGGTTWDTLNTNLKGATFKAITLFDENTGYAVTSQGLVKTTDGGLNWKIKAQGQLSNMSIIDKNTGFAIGDQGIILKITSSGIISTNSGVRTNLLSIKTLDNNTAIAVGDSGLILRTTDAGNTWKEIRKIPNEQLFSINFSDSKHGCAFGSLGLILVTDDGGISWIKKNKDNEIKDYVIVHFLNETTGFVAGGQGIIKTTDSGESWKIVSSNWANALFFNNDKAGFSAGYYGIMITSDGGETWTYTIKNSASFYDIHFTTPSTGFAVGNFGIIAKTTDGGYGWQFKFSNTKYFYLYGIHFPDENTGYAVGSNGTVLKTTDAGEKWFAVRENKYGDLTHVYFVNKDTGFACGGETIKTTDGGKTWSTVSNLFASNFHFINSQLGYAMGSNLSKTTDGGNTWINSKDPLPSGLRDIFFINQNLGYAVGWNGIMRTTNGGGLTSVTAVNSKPQSYSLSQNYPNPFNPSTNISYSIPVGQYVSLKIYDILGKEVDVLVNQYKTAGTHTVQFNGALLPSGLYIYTLQGGQYRESKKLLLLK